MDAAFIGCAGFALSRFCDRRGVSGAITHPGFLPQADFWMGERQWDHGGAKYRLMHHYADHPFAAPAPPDAARLSLALRASVAVLLTDHGAPATDGGAFDGFTEDVLLTGSPRGQRCLTGALEKEKERPASAAFTALPHGDRRRVACTSKLQKLPHTVCGTAYCMRVPHTVCGPCTCGTQTRMREPHAVCGHRILYAGTAYSIRAPAYNIRRFVFPTAYRMREFGKYRILDGEI